MSCAVVIFTSTASVKFQVECKWGGGNYFWDEPVCAHLDHRCCSVLQNKCEESFDYYTNAIHVPIILLCLQTRTLNQLLGAFCFVCGHFPLECSKFFNWMLLLTWIGMFLKLVAIAWAPSLKLHFFFNGCTFMSPLTRPYLKNTGHFQVCFKPYFYVSRSRCSSDTFDLLSLFWWNPKDHSWKRGMRFGKI